MHTKSNYPNWDGMQMYEVNMSKNVHSRHTYATDAYMTTTHMPVIVLGLDIYIS